MQTKQNLELIGLADAIRDDDEQAAHTGRIIATALRLKRDSVHRDRWSTNWGSKTDAGLARTVLAQMEASRIETAKDRATFITSEAAR